jgi:hypothetical protein
MSGKPIYIWFQQRGPDESTGFPGQICDGWYLIKKDKHGRDVLRLTDAEGNPDSYRRVLDPGDRPDSVARELLRRRESHNNPSGAFNRPLLYPRTGWR